MFIAKLVAYHTIDTLEGINQMLHTIHNAINIALDDHAGDIDDHHSHDYIVEDLLQRSRKFNPFVLNLIISDINGNILHRAGKPTPSEIIEEIKIKTHIPDLQENNFYVSGIFHKNRQEESPYFEVSVGFKNKQGKLGLIYTALIDYNHFKKDFAQLGIPEGTTIALGTCDGNILMRLPDTGIALKNYEPLKELWASCKDNGTNSIKSPFDKKQREIVFTRVGDYPFIAFASTSEEIILAEWWLYFWIMLAGLAILIIFSNVAFTLFAKHQKQSILYQDLLQEQAMLDPLTKLPNRRKFTPILEREFSLARRHSRPLALLIVDIDHFKLINDKHGHDRGDIVLVNVAETMQQLCRQTDICCRLGGEEFAMLLSETDYKGAASTAEKIRNSIEQLQINADGLQLNVTVSIGVSCYENGDNQPKEIMLRSDAALYKAKHMGRNCCYTQTRNETMKI